MNEEHTLPPLPTLEEVALQQDTYDPIAEELAQYWLDPTKDYPDPHFLFEYNGVGFSPLGGIQALSGQKKNGKTFVLAILMAVALGDGTPRVIEYLPGLNIRPSTRDYLKRLPRVLYCDTEMEQLNTAKVLRRVHWLCDWDMKKQYDNFNVLWLREVPKGEKQSANRERWRLIRLAIEQKNPDIVFIDGMRDLMDDFNDLKESSTIIGEMMSLASQRNMCIWNVLHMNPRPGNDDESKMRGHAGTELGNKVSDTFVSIKKKDPVTNQVTFTVKQQDARGKDIDDWKFVVTDDAGGLGIPRIINSSYVPVIPDQTQNERREADEYFSKYRWKREGDTYTNISNWLKSKCGRSNRQISAMFNIGLEAGIIMKNSKGKYVYCGNNSEELHAETEDIPFEKPNDNEIAPF